MSPLKRILIFAFLITAIVVVVFYFTGNKNSSIISPSTNIVTEAVSAIQEPESENFALPIYTGSSVALDGSAANAAFMGKKFKTVTYSTSDDIEKVLSFYRDAIGENLSEGKVQLAGGDNFVLSDNKSSRSFVIVNSSELSTKIQLIDQI